MLSDTPKVLHEIAHAPLVAHALQSARALAPERLVVVTGHGAAQVEAAVSQIDPEVRTVRQTEQLGTGHAVSVARTALEGVTGDLSQNEDLASDATKGEEHLTTAQSMDDANNTMKKFLMNKCLVYAVLVPPAPTEGDVMEE